MNMRIRSVLFLSMFGLAASLGAAPAPVIYYDFEDGPEFLGGWLITNKAPSATLFGLLQTTNEDMWTTGAPGGSTPGGGLYFNGVNFTNGGLYIETQFTSDTAGIRDSGYTVSAWANFDKMSGDAFFLGQLNANFLHIGFRNRLAHLGHYGSDLSGLSLLNTGVWYHIVWQFEGNTQRTYINGELENVQANKVVVRTAEPLLVGIAGNNGREYKGWLDELAVYDTVLMPSQIQYLAGGGSPLTLPESVPNRAFFTAPYGTNGTWNLYEYVGGEARASATWYDAYVGSTNVADPVAGTALIGHLVTIQSKPENEFVRRLLRYDNSRWQETVIADTWLGLTDNDLNSVGLVFPGAQESGTTNTVPDVNVRRTNGWVWVTGESYNGPAYRNWNANEPNDNPSEDAGLMTSGGGWNDYGSGIPGSGDPSYDRPYVVEWDINAPSPITNPTVAVRKVQAVLPSVLPGAESAGPGFTGYWVRDAGAVGGVRQGVERLLAMTGTVVQTTTNLPVINAYDPDVPSAVNAGFFPSNSAYFADAGGSVTDVNYTVVYRGYLDVKPGQAGRWTFGVRSDDGFALRLPGRTWLNAFGAGWIDHNNQSILTAEYGAVDARGQVDLVAGRQPIELVNYQGTGGSHHELYAVMGAFTNDADSSSWRLVGYTPVADIALPGMLDPGDGKGWTVWYSSNNIPGGLTNTDLAWQAVAEYVGGPSNTAKAAVINFKDPNNGAECEIVPSDPFPNDTPGVDDNNFAMFMEGTLVIPRTDTYYIGFRGDDGGWLQIEGQAWTRLVANQTGTSGIDGDKIVCNQNTGNSRTIGEITLAAGNYTIRSLFWEATGQGGFDIFATSPAVATQAIAAAASYFPITTGGAYVGTEPVQSLQLTASPANRFTVTGADLALAGSNLNLSWESLAGLTYRIEYSSNLMGTTWTPVETNILATGSTTTRSIPNAFSETNIAIRVVRE